MKWFWFLLLVLLLGAVYFQYGDNIDWSAFGTKDPEKIKQESLKAEIDRRTVHMNSSKSVVTADSIFRDTFENKLLSQARGEKHVILLFKKTEKIPLTYSEEKIKALNAFFIIIDNDVTFDSTTIPKSRIISIKK